MSKTSNPTVATLGIDIGKNSFHVVGLDQRGAIVLRQKWSRGQIEARLANMPPCLIGMEACVGAHHLSRKLQSLGHDARLMPAKYVRPYAKGQKNDFRDGETIAEAVQRPTMKFVATKTTEQLDLQALHRVRERLVSQRTGIINQIRAFLLERGVAVRQGIRFLRAELPRILASRSDVLSPRMVRVIEELAGDWHRLDERIEALSTDIKIIGRSGPGVRAVDDGAWHRTDHLERDGGRDRQRRGVLEGARLRRLARTGAKADVDWRPHDPRQDIEAR
jgi:transposase